VTEADWWGLLEASPGDRALLAGFALWLRDEAGDDAGAAWCAWYAESVKRSLDAPGGRRRPRVGGLGWWWYVYDGSYAEGYHPDNEVHAAVSGALFAPDRKAVGATTGATDGFPSRVAAERALLGAWRAAWAEGWRPGVEVKT
jgi:hypothetical protein